MRIYCLRYMRGRGALVVILILLFLTSPVVVRAGNTVQIAPDEVNFIMETRPSSNEYVKADKAVILLWKRNTEDNGTELQTKVTPKESRSATVTYYITEPIRNDNDREIKPRYIEAYLETSTGYNRGYRSLEHGLSFPKPENGWVKISFRIAPEAWGPAGTYTGWLRSYEPEINRDIKINVTINKYVNLSVGKTAIEIQANHGPGSYLATEPIKTAILANHKNWTLTVTGDPLKYISDSTPGKELSLIETGNVFIKRTGDGNERSDWKDLNAGVTLRGSSDFEIRDCEFIVKVITELQHTAGIYSGGLHFTVGE